MNAFIDKPDLQKSGFTGTVHKSEGRLLMHPGYFKNYTCTATSIKYAVAESWKKNAAETKSLSN